MKKLMIAAAAAATLSLSSMAQAQDPAAGAVTGAAVGAGVGAVVGGPPGAIVGGAIGGTVGAGAADAERSRREETVIIDQRAPVRERNCATSPSGTTVCEEIRR
jgi:hypothetical protein